MGHLTDASTRSEPGRVTRSEPVRATRSERVAAIPMEPCTANGGQPGGPRGVHGNPRDPSEAERKQRRRGRRRLEDVAHDLRDPLQTLRMAAAALSSTGLDEGQRDGLVSSVLRSAEMVQDMVLGLLEGDLAANGGRPLHVQPLEVQRFLEETRERFRLEAEQRNVTIDVELPPGPTLAVRADRSLLDRVLSNLIRNALAHSGCDRITLAAAQMPDGTLRCEVRDTGRGIPAEERARIFRYSRHEGDERQASPGLGLGIVKRSVGLHGGRVWVESEPGQGTTFYFTIPARG